MKRKLYLLLLAVLPGVARSQCNPPTSIGAPIITAASCPGNGRIQVSSVTPSGTYQYQLRNASNTVIKPWQDSASFVNVDAGSYVIEVRTVCSTGFSTPSVRGATVANTYSPATILSTSINRRAQCNNGRFSTSATGSGPLQYALVTGLNVADIPANLMRPKQSSNIFDSLAAGTYYVRVYDACGGYATQAVTMPAFTTAASFTAIQFYRYACDSFVFSFNTTGINRSPGTQDVNIIKFWTTFPDGTTDTLGPDLTNNTFQRLDFPFSYSRLDPAYNPSLRFPDNIGSWPKNLTIGFKNACGTITTQNVVMNDPDSLRLNVNFNENVSASTCDTITTYFTVTHKNTITGNNSLISPVVMYTIDNGTSWHPAVSSGYSASSGNILLARSTAYTLKVAYCGDTLVRSFSTPAQGVLNPGVAEDNSYSCPGKTGIQLLSNNHNGPLTIEMLSAPAGQTLVPPFVDTFSAGTWRTPVPLRQLATGAYTLRITDSIGSCPDRMITISPTLTHPLQLDYNMSYNCAGALLVSTTNQYVQFGSSGIHFSIFLKLKVFDAANNQVFGGSNGVSGNTSTVPGSTTVTIPSATISGWPDGNYTIRMYLNFGAGYTNQTCTIVDKPFVKSPNVLNLSASRFIAGCAGDSNSAVIVGAASGGLAPYQYSLYRNAYNPDSLIVASSPNNIFNNLDANTTYYVHANDQCGNGNNIALSISQAGIPVMPDATLMPCPGDDLQLQVDSMPNVSYQWYKNAAAIGNTQPRLSLSNIQYADSGRYRVQVTMGSCEVMSKSFYLDPAVCGQPLAVSLSDFTARAAGGKALLEWETLTESDSRGFDIERSTDGRNWQQAGYRESLAQQGYSNGPLRYFFTDAQPAAGINHYRLKHWETTGRYSYSEVRMLSFSPGNKVSIVPNPVKGRLHIVCNDPGQISHAVLSDAAGRVLRWDITVREGIDMSGYAPGMYLLQIVMIDGRVQTEKVMKQ